jgi:hypothetical protein
MHLLYLWLPTAATVLGLAQHRITMRRMLKKHMRQVNMISSYNKHVDTE